MIKIMTDKMLNERISQERSHVEEQMWQRQRMSDLDKQIWELEERIRKIESRLDGNKPEVLERIHPSVLERIQTEREGE